MVNLERGREFFVVGLSLCLVYDPALYLRDGLLAPDLTVSREEVDAFGAAAAVEEPVPLHLLQHLLEHQPDVFVPLGRALHIACSDPCALM